MCQSGDDDYYSVCCCCIMIIHFQMSHCVLPNWMRRKQCYNNASDPKRVLKICTLERWQNSALLAETLEATCRERWMQSCSTLHIILLPYFSVHVALKWYLYFDLEYHKYFRILLTSLSEVGILRSFNINYIWRWYKQMSCGIYNVTLTCHTHFQLKIWPHFISLFSWNIFIALKHRQHNALINFLCNSTYQHCSEEQNLCINFAINFASRRHYRVVQQKCHICFVSSLYFALFEFKNTAT